MDYSICKALSYNMEDIPVALVMYDIMCQYQVHFQLRVKNSPELSLLSSLELQTGIGLFHIHGHQDSCLPRFSPSFIPGSKQVNGEIIETLWAPLNNISQSLWGMSLMHWQEVLDAHINHSNWKKLVQIGITHPFDALSCLISYHSSLSSQAVETPGVWLWCQWMCIQGAHQALQGQCQKVGQGGAESPSKLAFISGSDGHIWYYQGKRCGHQSGII